MIKAAGKVVMALLLGVAVAALAAEDPVKVLEKTVTRSYKDLALTVHLVKTAKSGRERPMDLVVKIKDDGKIKKTLAEFTGPDEVKGMKSLSWDYSAPGQEPDRWFKLAGLDWVKCRGKACENLEDQFGFTMDIFAVKLDEAVHTMKGEETVDGAACYKIESKIKDPSKREDPVILTWVDKQKFAARKIEAYGPDGKLSQTSTFSQFKQIGDHWWETSGQLTKVKSGKKIAFSITDSQINAGIPDDIFAKPQKFKVEENKK
jgi:hypothetical protein